MVGLGVPGFSNINKKKTYGQTTMASHAANLSQRQKWVILPPLISWLKRWNTRNIPSCGFFGPPDSIYQITDHRLKIDENTAFISRHHWGVGKNDKFCMWIGAGFLFPSTVPLTWHPVGLQRKLLQKHWTSVISSLKFATTYTCTHQTFIMWNPLTNILKIGNAIQWSPLPCFQRYTYWGSFCPSF